MQEKTEKANLTNKHAILSVKFLHKGQLISKQFFLFLFEPKTEQNYFWISALASKKRSD